MKRFVFDILPLGKVIIPWSGYGCMLLCASCIRLRHALYMISLRFMYDVFTFHAGVLYVSRTSSIRFTYDLYAVSYSYIRFL